VLTLRSWIDAMLRCRSVRVEIRRSSVRMLVNWGCPQGRELSPLLWNFYNPRLFGTELRMTDQVKHLGVILDKKLDWILHALLH
jgi:hypothetical protein